MGADFGFKPKEQPDSFFISYNSPDAARIAPIVRELKDKGVPVWYDYGLGYGTPWKKEIARHIERSKAFILFVTKNLVQRTDLSYVQIEYELARYDYKKTVYIVFMDHIDSSDVVTDNKMWWREINHLHCITNPSVKKIMEAIGFTEEDHHAPGKAMSASDYYRMGEDYFNGRNGKKRDYAEAVKCYRLAADQGHLEAQKILGLCYYYGQGVDRDYGMTIKYYTLASKQGDDWAQFNLAYFYEYGRGVEKDVDEAIRLYRLAAQKGNEGAKKALAKLEAKD